MRIRRRAIYIVNKLLWYWVLSLVLNGYWLIDVSMEADEKRAFFLEDLWAMASRLAIARCRKWCLFLFILNKKSIWLAMIRIWLNLAQRLYFRTKVNTWLMNNWLQVTNLWFIIVRFILLIFKRITLNWDHVLFFMFAFFKTRWT